MAGIKAGLVKYHVTLNYNFNMISYSIFMKMYKSSKMNTATCFFILACGDAYF